MFWKTMALKDELAREMTYGKPQLLWQKDVAMRDFIDFDSGIDEYMYQACVRQILSATVTERHSCAKKAFSMTFFFDTTDAGAET